MELAERIKFLENRRAGLVERRSHHIPHSKRYESLTRRIHHTDERLGYLRGRLKMKADTIRTLRIRKLMGDAE